ncbi:MAG: hypothetical protein IAE91_14695 [Ignavibacteriaceae bacterium]|nr:hypothetical protein [Ignavibacteriaceae bacterium]
MNKIAIITGVSRELGFGYKTDKQLKDLGFTVISIARNIDTVPNHAGKL